jgi:hypothetical protein
MNELEKIFLSIGAGWYLSKLLPYIILPLLAFLFSFFIVRNRLKKRWLRLALMGMSPILIFGVYFLIHPIYEGDFSNVRQVKKLTAQYKALLPENQFTVVSIPNCPFCYEAMDKMLMLKKRNPSMHITYYVCSKDESTLKWYQQKAGDDIEVQLAPKPDELIQLTGTSFPAFVLNATDGNVYVWKNRFFGVAAIDEVEKLISQH